MVGAEGLVYGIEKTAKVVKTARRNIDDFHCHLRQLMLLWPSKDLPGKHPFSKVNIKNDNGLLPSCTNGRQFDVIYCECNVEPNDLPALVGLLKINGRPDDILGPSSTHFYCVISS